MRGVSDAYNDLIGAASRAVARAGLAREIRHLELKIKKRKEALGVEVYGPLDDGDDARARRLCAQASHDVRALEHAIELKVGALEALRAAAAPDAPPPPPPPDEDPAARDRRLAEALSAAAADLARVLAVSTHDAEDALRRSHGDSEAAAALLLDEGREIQEAEVLSVEPLHVTATVVAEDAPKKKKASITKRLSASLRRRPSSSS